MTTIEYKAPELVWALPGSLPIKPAPIGSFPLTEEGCIAQGFRKHFQCQRCKQYKPVLDTGGTGYGYASDTGEVRCYKCCAESERESMRSTGKTVAYITRKPDAGMEPLIARNSGRHKPLGFLVARDWKVSDWPGELSLNVMRIKRSEHNWHNVYRLDVWFVFEGYIWHGVNLGDNDLLRCKRTKTEWIQTGPGSWGPYTRRKSRATKGN